MAVQTITSNLKQDRTSERTPLLRSESPVAHLDTDSEQTLLAARSSGNDDDGEANQKVGGRRAVLIAFGLWGLIFLQGKFNHLEHNFIGAVD